MIDLNKFAEEKEVIMPIVNGWGQINGRKVFIPNIEDNWYKVKLGSKPSIIKKSSPLESFKAMGLYHLWRVYSLAGEGIPFSFNNFFQKGLGETVNVNFMSLPIFQVAQVIQWEDKRFYFYGIDSEHTIRLKGIEEFFNKKLPLSGKGITPELRYYWLLLSLQRQSYEELEALKALKLSEAEKVKRLKEFESSFPGRLQKIIEDAQGQLVKFSKINKNSYLVEWRVKNSDQLVKSTIRDDMKILNLGFCASGDDKSHSMSSAVQLANMYGELYITRD